MDVETSGDRVEQKMADAGPTVDELISLGFSKETLAGLGNAIAVTRLVAYAAGETLYHESDQVEALYVIRDGRIKLLNFLENGRARIVRLHNRGAIIGLNGIMDEHHTHTAVAIDDVQVYQIPMHLIKIVKEEDPDTYCHLLEYWNEYLQMADTWITDFSTGAIRGRVARLLKYQTEVDVEEATVNEVTLLTVEEMADILGVTPESVSRIMAEFKRNGILHSNSDDIPDRYHCDMKKLLHEAEQ